MSKVYFTKDHEWIKVDGNEGTVGITTHAQQQLGDVVFVELPEAGAEVAQGDEVAVVESVKAASEIYAPVSGRISAVNEELPEEPAKVNESPEEAGWFFKIELSDAGELDGLMDESAYQSMTSD